MYNHNMHNSLIDVHSVPGIYIERTTSAFLVGVGGAVGQLFNI